MRVVYLSHIGRLRPVSSPGFGGFAKRAAIAAQGFASDPAIKKYRDAVREADTLGNKDELTTADEQRLEQLQAVLENPPYDDVEANTLSAMAAQYAKMPSVAGALKTAALTPRDFAKFVLAVSRAAMISGVQKQESRWRYPPVFRRRTSRLPRITNRYNVRLGIGGFTLGALLDGTRTGNDGIVGTLVWNEDKDTYEGTVNAWARGTQKITSTLTGSFQCPSAESHGWQELDVVGTKIPAFGPAHKLSDYSWTSGDHGGGYVSLEFFVATPPRYLKRDRCQTNIGGWTSEASGHTPAWLLPFNDAQWTVEHAGYGIALPNKGKLVYVDNTSRYALTGNGPMSPDGGREASRWFVQVEAARQRADLQREQFDT